MITYREYLFWLFWAFILTAPSVGRYGFFTGYVGIPDDSYRMIRYVMCLIVFLKVIFDSNLIIDIFKCYPLFLIILINNISYYFASDVAWSLTQSTVMLTTTVAAMCFGIYLRNYFKKFCIDLVALAMWMSLFFVLVLPDFGTLSPYLQSVGLVGDPGSWLGVFASKNELGHVAGVCTSVIFVFGRTVMPPRVYFMTLLVALICLFKSQSASGIVLLVSGVIFYHSVKSSITNNTISISNIIQLLVIILFIIFGSEIFESVLDLLGKDATFTGRDEIWQYGLNIINQKMPFGMGYGFSWTPEFLTEMVDTFGVIHLHNAYLELLVNLGLFSLSYFFIFIFAMYKGLLSWRSGNNEAELYVTVLFIWLLSGLSEPMIIRPSGFMSFIGYLILGAIYLLPTSDNSYVEDADNELGKRHYQ